MKREERHHLKGNPLAVFLVNVGEFFYNPGRIIVVTVILFLIVAIGFGGYLFWQNQRNDRIGELMANAMLVVESEVIQPPNQEGTDSEQDSSGDSLDWEQPENSFSSEASRLEMALLKLLAVADEYPSSPQGISARFMAASSLVELDRLEEASAQYLRVIELDDDQIYGRMAVFGLAEVNLMSGNYESAITLLKAESESVESPIPLDAVLMQLGRVYQLAGKDAEALGSFSRIGHEFPLSLYLSDAQSSMESLTSSSVNDFSSDE